MKRTVHELILIFRFAFVVLAGVLLIAMLIAVITHKLRPKQFESTFVVEFRPIEEFGEVGDERFYQSECERIVSAEVLRGAAKRRDLPKIWSKDEETTVALLQESVSCELIAGSKMGRVRVVNSIPQTTQEIAAALFTEYVAGKLERQAQEKAQRLKQIDILIEEQADQVEGKRRVLDSIVRITEKPYFEDAALRREFTGKLLEEYSNEELLDWSAESWDFAESQKAFEMSRSQLDELKAEFFELKTLVPQNQSPAILVEQPEVARAPLSWANGFSSTFEKALCTWMKLASGVIAFFVFFRSFSWTQGLKPPRLSQPS